MLKISTRQNMIIFSLHMVLMGCVLMAGGAVYAGNMGKAAQASNEKVQGLAYIKSSTVSDEAGAGLNKEMAIDDSGTTSSTISAAIDEDGQSSSRFALKSFYQERQGRVQWIDHERGHPKVRQILAVLEDSWTHGLNPYQYNIREIRRLLEENSGKREDLIRLEWMVSEALVKYGQNLTGMRIDPQSVGQKAEYWRQPMDAKDVLRMLSEAVNLEAALEELVPKGELYRRLQSELVLLTTDEADYDSLLPMKFGGKLFYPGDRHADVIKLRKRLQVVNDSPEGAGSEYDDALASKVMSFQRAHGLLADGILGPKTLAILNRTKQDRIDQVIANLERLRWLEQERPSRYILVNIPSQTLWAVDSNNIVHEMPVIVGQPARQTKSFKVDITGVRFNPKWTVPLRIKMEDFLPKLKKDHNYLGDKGIEVYRGYGENAVTVDPSSIDWNHISRAEMNMLRMVQMPGNSNALGRIRILMDNPYDIYMHDTNSPKLFELSERTLSSGCIRMARPDQIARFVLQDNNNWSDEKMWDTFRTLKTTDVRAAKTIPAYILYHTVWLNAENDLIFGADVYDLDKRLVRVLEKNKGYLKPKDILANADVFNPDSKLASSQLSR